MPKAKEVTYSATGRRKTSIARVTLKPGSGQISVNGRPYEEYFPTVTLQNQLLAPLQLTNESKNLDVEVRSTGGGIGGQMGAVRHGISRALLKVNAEYRGDLKKAGFLKPRPACQGAEEARPARRTEALPVLEALVGSRSELRSLDSEKPSPMRGRPFFFLGDC